MRAPGVYREEIFLKPESRLSTGVVGFAGFADTAGKPRPPDEPVALHHKDDFAQYFRGRSGSYLAPAVAGFFDNGGRRCHVARADSAGKPEEALQRAVRALDSVDDVDLIALPDAMTLRLPDRDGGFAELRVDAIRALQRWLLGHCAERGNCFAILDALPAHAAGDAGAALPGPPLPPAHAMNGAMYFPWLRVDSGVAGDVLLPPCGHVAGVYARSDARVGVFKAPANEVVRGVLDLESTAEPPAGANAVRAFPGRGLRVWGARTLSADPQWRYVNVRRLAITLRRRIDRDLSWAAFEPATPALWLRIERELSAWLDELWRSGALQGATPRQAYYVKCDAETNPGGAAADRVVTEIGFAPTLPAEFVVLRIVHRAGSVDDDQDDDDV